MMEIMKYPYDISYVGMGIIVNKILDIRGQWYIHVGIDKVTVDTKNGRNSCNIEIS